MQTRIEDGAFPATTAELQLPGVPGHRVPVLRRPEGQRDLRRVRQPTSPTGWSYLPFQVYANSIFNDTVGKAYVSDTTLADGLKAWQDASVKYGNEQGFTVNK